MLYYIIRILNLPPSCGDLVVVELVLPPHIRELMGNSLLPRIGYSKETLYITALTPPLHTVIVDDSIYQSGARRWEEKKYIRETFLISLCNIFWPNPTFFILVSVSRKHKKSETLTIQIPTYVCFKKRRKKSEIHDTQKNPTFLFKNHLKSENPRYLVKKISERQNIHSKSNFFSRIYVEKNIWKMNCRKSKFFQPEKCFS